MPPALRMKVPALLLAFDHVCGKTLPGDIDGVVGELRSTDRHQVGYERVEEPFFLLVSTDLFVVAGEFSELLARVDAELDTPIPQHFAGLTLVNLRIHVERGKQWIERRSRSVHQKGFIEAFMLDVAPLSPDVLITFVDL